MTHYSQRMPQLPKEIKKDSTIQFDIYLPESLDTLHVSDNELISTNGGNAPWMWEVVVPDGHWHPGKRVYVVHENLITMLTEVHVISLKDEMTMTLIEIEEEEEYE